MRLFGCATGLPPDFLLAGVYQGVQQVFQMCDLASGLQALRLLHHMAIDGDSAIIPHTLAKQVFKLGRSESPLHSKLGGRGVSLELRRYPR